MTSWLHTLAKYVPGPDEILEAWWEAASDIPRLMETQPTG